MKQIILPLTVLEFTRLVIDGFMEENGLAPSPKKEIRFPQSQSPSYINLLKKWLNSLIAQGVCEL